MTFTLFAEIQPADVYERVIALEMSMRVMMYMGCVLTLLVITQLVAKVVIFRKVVEYFVRAEKILAITEHHARIDDDHRGRVQNQIQGVKEEVVKVPDRTVDKINDALPKTNPRNDGPKVSLIWPFTTAIILTAAGITGASMNLSSQKDKPEVALTTSRKPCQGIEVYEQGMEFMRNGDHVAALPLFLKARYMMTDPEPLARAAECAFCIGEHRQSLGLCHELMAREAKCGRAYLIRGLIYEAQGNTALAKDYWETAAAYGDLDAELKLRKRKV
jgi:hypothetical protein